MVVQQQAIRSVSNSLHCFTEGLGKVFNFTSANGNLQHQGYKMWDHWFNHSRELAIGVLYHTL